MLLVVGCTSSGTVPTVGPSALPTSSPDAIQSSDVAAVVPWSSATPAPFLTPAPTSVPDAPACRVDQLAAGNAYWGGAGGSLAGGFVIWDTSSRPCRIEGRPAIEIVDAAGHRLDLATVPVASPAAEPIVLNPNQPAPAPHEETPVGLASVWLSWSNWCGSPPKEPLSLVVTLPAGGVLRLRIEGGTPRCDAEAFRSSLSVGAFEATSGPSPTDPPTIPAEALKLTLVVPDEGVIGEPLRYVAILTNPTANPITLDPCPAYQERINTEGGPVVADYLLDCVSVPVIAPGASVRFAMELDIPAMVPPADDAAIVWALEPYFSEGFPPRPPEQKLSIRIVAR